MDKVRFLIESFGRKPLLVILVSILLLTTALSEVAPSQANEADKQKVVRQTAQKWIQVGMEQYKRGFYKAAEQSFLRAQEYQAYLTAAERKELSELLEKTHIAIAASEVAPSQANETNKKKVVRQTAQKWIQVGMEQYKRGFYKAAEQSFLRAQEYQAYLTAAEREKLSELLEKTHIAAIERKRILGHIQTANELAKQGQPIKAKAHLERARGSKFLTEEERKLITERLRKIDNQLDELKKETAELYNRSVDFYRDGQFKKAREGFIKVANNGLLAAPAGKTAEDYIAKIDSILGRRARPSAATKAELQDITKPTVTIEDELLGLKTKPAQKALPQIVLQKRKPAVAAEPVTDKGSSYLEVINRKRNILRGHTKAVVNDAVVKAQSYISQGEFDKAKEVVETAERTVHENHLHLGDYLFKQYSSQLKQLTEQIVQGQSQRARQLQEHKRLEAIEAQRRYREQMEIDREKRIAALMDNAMAYQKQQRYEEALGQLESLLAIDPLNNQALIQKQMLEDIIGFRKQLEVQKEADKERVGILMKTDMSGIPYAEEITHPRNWREIAAKRKAKEAIGQDPANVAVYEQLDKIVDLLELTPEMTFSDAIEELKKAVEPPLKIVVLWRDLYEYEIEQTTPINMDAISAVPLGTALELLLRSVSAGYPELGYVVEGGVIIIATIEALPSKLVRLVYDVTDLLGRPADFYSISGGGVGGRGGSRGGRGGSSGGRSGGTGGEVFEEYFDEEEEEMDRVELAEEAKERLDDLKFLIQETVEPDSWFETGTGEGTITFYEHKKLVVRQTLEVHKEIEKLLKELREAFGDQIAIEARFLLVGENFLEDIGLDIDFNYDFGGKLGRIDFQQGSSNAVRPEATGILGSWGKTLEDTEVKGLKIEGGYGSMLDDLRVKFILRAVQAHRDSKALTAPKVTVLSGEMATIRVQRTIRYALPPDIETSDWETGYGYGGTSGITQNYAEVPTGTILNITPTITPDKKHVLLNIVTELRSFLEWEITNVQIPVGPEGEVRTYEVKLPQTEISRVKTRVAVPDGGTLLLGGQKVTAEVEREAGVPILSKIPIIGRAFSNRSKIKDHKILLILVKPTIILQEEADTEAIAAMESDFF